MSRKAVSLILILSLLVSVLAGTLLIQNATKVLIVRGDTVTNGNTIIDGNPDANVTITSPESKVYNTDNVTLAFTIESNAPPQEDFSGSLFDIFLRHGCALDYDTSKLVNLIVNTNLLDDFPDNPSVALSNLGNNLYGGNVSLTDLSQGPYNITVWVRAEQDYLSYGVPVGSVFATVSFNIDSIPPNISIISPETKVYNTSDVPLDFTVNKTVSQISYSLDGQENITAIGNMTLLSGGAHNVTVYATDEAGNVGSSQIITFTIALAPLVRIEPFPTATVAAVSGALIAIACVGLFLYLRKNKH
jgi:hypothetical protein